MKKALHNTKSSVKLRKSEYRDEWYLYIESYPVFTPGKNKPQRVREYVNRVITTPIWDKKRTARTDSEGNCTYKPKRDVNGVIMCKSPIDYHMKPNRSKQTEEKHKRIVINRCHTINSA